VDSLQKLVANKNPIIGPVGHGNGKIDRKGNLNRQNNRHRRERKRLTIVSIKPTSDTYVGKVDVKERKSVSSGKKKRKKKNQTTSHEEKGLQKRRWGR